MLLFDVTQKFNTAVKIICKRQHVEELIPFCADHPRRPVMLNNLCNQVVLYERRFKSQSNLKHVNEIMATVAYDESKCF